MTIPYNYSYLIFALFFLPVWLILYFHRKDLRKEMLFMSIAIGIFGFFPEYYL